MLFRGFLGRISIFLGVIVGYIVALLRGEVDFSAVNELVADGRWVGLPTFHFPTFGSPGTWSVIAMFLPVVLVLIAENVGHVRGVATMTDASVNRYTGRALIARPAQSAPIETETGPSAAWAIACMNPFLLVRADRPAFPWQLPIVERGWYGSTSRADPQGPGCASFTSTSGVPSATSSPSPAAMRTTRARSGRPPLAS